MIKLNTIEGRTIYVNPSLIASIEVAEQVVHLQAGNQWYKLKETEDEIVSKLMNNSPVVYFSALENKHERF